MFKTVVLANERAKFFLWLYHTTSQTWKFIEIIILLCLILIIFFSSPPTYLQIFIKNKYPSQVFWHHIYYCYYYILLLFFKYVFIFCLPINNAGWMGLNLGLKHLKNNKDFHFSVNIVTIKLLLTVLNKNSNLVQKAYLFTEYLFMTTMTILIWWSYRRLTFISVSCTDCFMSSFCCTLILNSEYNLNFVIWL